MKLIEIPENIINEFPIIGEFIKSSTAEVSLKNCVADEGFEFIQEGIKKLDNSLMGDTELKDSYKIDDISFKKVEDIQSDFFDIFNEMSQEDGRPFYAFEGREFDAIDDTSRDMMISHFNATVAVYTILDSDTSNDIFILIQQDSNGAYTVHSILFQYKIRDENTNDQLRVFVFGSDTEDKGVNRYRIIRFNTKDKSFADPCSAFLSHNTAKEGYTFINNIGEASLVPLHKSALFATMNNELSKWDILIDTYQDTEKSDKSSRFLYTSTKGKDEMFAGFKTASGKIYVIYEITMNTGYLNFKASILDDFEMIPSFFNGYKHEVRYYSFKTEDIHNKSIDLSSRTHDDFPRDIIEPLDVKKVMEMFIAFNNFETFADLLGSSERVNNSNADHIYHWDHLGTDTGVFEAIISERRKYEKI